MRRVLAEQFGKQQRWVCWRYEELKGKKTKIPYAINGKKASSTDKKTWCDYAAAAEAANKDNTFDGVGLVFTPSQILLGIDIDHCVKGKSVDHPLKKQIERFIKAADTYCELSPSKEGLHLFLQLDEAFTPKHNKKAPYELYTKGRYFTVTNESFGPIKNVRTVTIAEVEKLLEIIEYPWTKEVEAESPRSDNAGQNAASASLVDALDDKQVLNKMFASKNGEDIKRLYDGDISDYGDDASKADMALTAHLAFWTAKNKTQMEKLWLGSPLGSREKTKTRLDYRTRTLDAAIKHCKEVYTPPLHASKSLDLLFTLTKDKEKIYTQNTENMCRILRKHPEFAGQFKFDVFKSVLFYKNKPLQDSQIIDVQSRIAILFSVFGKVGKEMVYDAIIKVSNENEFDSAADYIKALKWDGAPRLDSWLMHTYGTPEDTYHKAVGSNWLKGLVKRIIEPGCKFDYVLVLEGKQGAKKSMSLSVLGGDWHSETTMSTDNKDFFMQFQGKAIIEFSEGETMSRTEVKKMKAIITTQVDRYRAPWGKVSMDYPRRCVFAMTTNQDEYLKDETGNRRWLPVTVRLPHANIEWLAENRKQLFAEAHYRLVEKKETVYDFPEAETIAEQHKRRVEDPNFEVVQDWYYTQLTPTQRAAGVTILQVVREALHQGFGGSITKGEQMSVAVILREFMDLDRRQVMDEGKRQVKWFSKIEEELVPSSLAF